MKNWLRTIKWAYQRVRYGYDETIMWGFDGYFSQFIKPLKKFCEKQLEVIDDLNPVRDVIYKETLRLIAEWEKQSYEDMFHGTKDAELWEYFGKHISYYWN